MEDGTIRIHPLGSQAVQPSSVDVRLGRVFHRFRDWHGSRIYKPIDPASVDHDDTERIESDEFVLPGKEMVLGTVMERISVPHNMVCRIHGKSSIGRLGLCVHITAGLIDAGNELNITLEMYNFRPRPMILRAGMKIAQIEYELLTSPCEIPYGHPSRRSRYFGDTEAMPTRVSENL
jgi:dCTP deaminase